MEFTRRGLGNGGGAALLSFLPFRANAAAVDDLIAEFTGGAEMGDSGRRR